MTILVLRFLHILFMAAWFGSSLFAAGDTRRTLGSADSDLDLLADRLGRYGRVAGVSAILTILTGFGLIFALGGFAVVPKVIHVSILTAFAMWGVGMFVIGGATRKITVGIKEQKPREELLGHAKKISMGTGIFHLLWLTTLVLMVFRTQLF